MDYQELRDKVQSWPKYPGCVKVARAPLIHDGFPGTFNLSFNEHHWLNEHGRYVNFDHDYIFSTIQTCIRPDDLPKLKTNDSYKYLGVFELADITGNISLAQRPDYKELQTWQISQLIKFLGEFGIPPNRIHPSFCAGGTVAELTKEKYTFSLDIPRDTISKQAFLEAGVPERNLLPDKTQDTFLSLHLHRPTPWGYRTEINVNIGRNYEKDLLDVATTEYTPYQPIYQGNQTTARNIEGLESSKSGFSIVACGLERLCMAINDLPRVRDVDYIACVYETYDKLHGTSNEFAVENLRALHRIFSDIQAYGCQPGRHQKEKIRKILQAIPPNLATQQLREILTVNSQAQPWHPELSEGIEPTIERINRYRFPR